jgi:outer membrane protein OmpA-like peptidoglycan-associated protein
MTATTFEATAVQAAPRRLVEDAWRTLNQRYAIGTGVLVAVLAVLWLVGMGPGREVDSPVGSGAGSGVPAVTAPVSAVRPGGEVSGAVARQASEAVVAAAPSVGSSGATASPAVGNGSASAGSGPAPAPAEPTTRAIPGAPIARIYFEPDQAWPSGEVGPKLAPVLARLKAEPSTKALVSGFHDRRGSVEKNAALASRRAQGVRRVLIREGIAADRSVLAKPQQTQGTGPDREARRVEVTVAR